MAKAVINLQKESGGITKISSADGTGVTELVVPESGNLVSVDTTVTDNSIARYDGTTGRLQNSGVVIDDNGNLLLKSGTGALGYGAGAGGTVTQLTSKTTAVTLNKPTGTITMNNSAIPAGGYAIFNFTCDLLTAFDCIKFQLVSGYTNYESYTIDSSISNGPMVRVIIRNITAMSLSESLILNYTIIKGSNS